MLPSRLVIQSITEEIKDFKTFRFEDGHGVSYKPGQFLTLLQYGKEQETRRSYSIISSPLLHEPLAIGVKRIDNGIFSRSLIDQARTGDVLLSSGAGGLFVFPDDLSQYRQVFFMAAGSGITPILSLLKTALYGHPHLKAVLFYSNPSPEKTAYQQYLIQLSIEFGDRFQLRFLFSNEQDLLLARLNRESLLRLLALHARHHFTDCLFYVCGPEAYMRMCLYTLQEEGVPAENIRRENFVIEKKTVPKKSPPDTQTHSVTVHLQNGSSRFDVEYPDTILQAARKNKLDLPYSCETGRCGNCVARLLSGEVWLSYNEVLTDKDLKEGLTLTCTGHPVGGDVEMTV